MTNSTFGSTKDLFCPVHYIVWRYTNFCNEYWNGTICWQKQLCAEGNAMMAARWKEVKFKAPIPIEKQKNLESWARCFSDLISTGAEIKRDRNPHLKLFQTGNTSNARVTIWVTVPLS